jgi:predicted  nucleic acid-binding Zn-ribbon protein
VHPDVEALLALQADDQAIRQLEERHTALAPRERALDAARRTADEALQRARTAVEDEERRKRELQGRIAQHKKLQEHNVAQLDAVKRLKEATAAMSQIEQARRILADEESELAVVTRRIGELRAAADVQEAVVHEIDAHHADDRAAIAAARAEIDAALAVAREARTAKAAHVERPLLMKYDRIRGARKDGAIYALRGPSCSNCDTSVPMQRRNLMMARGNIEVCEVCGVLLYAVPPAPPPPQATAPA